MRQFRKPLMVFSPKNLLRHPKCKSSLEEFDDVPDDQVCGQPDVCWAGKSCVGCGVVLLLSSFSITTVVIQVCCFAAC